MLEFLFSLPLFMAYLLGSVLTLLLAARYKTVSSALGFLGTPSRRYSIPPRRGSDGVGAIALAARYSIPLRRGRYSIPLWRGRDDKRL